MQKLKMSLDDLRVESFATGRRTPRSGTVVANERDDCSEGEVTWQLETAANTCWCTVESCHVSCPGGRTCQQETCGVCPVVGLPGGG